jgi:cupin 2 domain-containing protein
MMIAVANLLTALPDAKTDEVAQVLLSGQGLRLERIVSNGQASPPDFWYDQQQAEWVMVLKGRARLLIDGEDADRSLGEGDAVFLPAHCRHRVTWTDPDRPTVWLALFVDPSLAPTTASTTQ